MMDGYCCIRCPPALLPADPPRAPIGRRIAAGVQEEHPAPHPRPSPGRPADDLPGIADSAPTHYSQGSTSILGPSGDVGVEVQQHLNGFDTNIIGSHEQWSEQHRISVFAPLSSSIYHGLVAQQYSEQ